LKKKLEMERCAIADASERLRGRVRISTSAAARRVVTPRAFFETAPHGELDSLDADWLVSRPRAEEISADPAVFLVSPSGPDFVPGIAAHTPVSNARNPPDAMFAIAAQTTVRATAQVKASKVAAKEQKSS
jgi:hypothetical protein